MPPIKSSASKRYTLLATSISLNGEIISPYSYYTKKGLVCVAITVLFSCQPSFCFKYTKANIYASYNMHLVSVNKYISLFSVILFCLSPSLGMNTW